MCAPRGGAGRTGGAAGRRRGRGAAWLDEPMESAVQALLAPRPAFREQGQRPRAFASRADLARVSALLDEAEATVALLGALGLSPAALGPKAEEAGLGPAALKASSALWALVESNLRAETLSLGRVADDVRTRSPGFDQKLDELFQNAVQNENMRRASGRLRDAITG